MTATSRRRRSLALLAALAVVACAVGVVVHDVPTVAATGDCSDEDTDEDTPEPCADETDSESGGTATAEPTEQPAGEPTGGETEQPTGEETEQPTGEQTEQPTGGTTEQPAGEQTEQPPGEPTQPPPTPTPAPVTVEGEPDVDVFLPDNTVAPGEQRRLVVQIANGGTVDDEGLDTPPEGRSSVTTARDVSVELEDGDAPVTVDTAETALGDLPSGSVAEAGFDVRVDEDADPGVYDLDVTVEYEYTEEITDDDSDRESEEDTFEVALVVTESGRFVIQSVDADLQAGETGPVEVELENVGEEDLRDATVTVRSPNDDLRLGDDDEAARAVGDWDDGDTEEIAVDATLSADAAEQAYPLELTVSYTDGNGDRRTSEVLVASVVPDGEQSFSVSEVTSTLGVGEEGRVDGVVENDGPRDVETAVIRVTDTDDNVELRERTVVLGDLDEDDEADFSLPVSVLDTAQPGERRLTVVIEYVTEEGDLRESDPIQVVVDVSSETRRFELTSVDARLQATDDGPLVLAIANRGNETLTDATVSLASRSSALLVGDGLNDTRFVGRWPPGESRLVEYRVRAGNGTGDQTYAFEATVAFEDEEGQPRRSDGLAFGATPLAEQTFAARTVESTLRVGEEGRVRVALTNTGPTAVSDVGVTLVTEAQNVAPVETEAAVGDLAAAETVEFELPIEITENAASGTRQLSYRVAYTDDDGDRRRTDLLTTDVDIAPERDTFVVDDLDATVTAGDSGVVELTLTNNRGVTVTDVQAKAFADDPLSVADDQVFVSSLAPGESVTVQFTVSAAGSAAEKPYRLSVDFLYTTPDGDTELTDPVNVGVSVVQPPPQQLPDWLVPLLVGFLVLIVAAFLLRRRFGGGTSEAPGGEAPVTARGDPGGSGSGVAAEDGGVDDRSDVGGGVSDGGADDGRDGGTPAGGTADAEVHAPKEPDWFVDETDGPDEVPAPKEPEWFVDDADDPDEVRAPTEPDWFVGGDGDASAGDGE